MDIFLDLCKNDKISHMYFDDPLILEKCYILALTPDNKTNNISRHNFNKNTGLYIFVFTTDRIYTYENFNYDNKNLYDMANKIDVNNFIAESIVDVMPVEEKAAYIKMINAE